MEEEVEEVLAFGDGNVLAGTRPNVIPSPSHEESRLMISTTTLQVEPSRPRQTRARDIGGVRIGVVVVVMPTTDHTRSFTTRTRSMREQSGHNVPIQNNKEDTHRAKAPELRWFRLLLLLLVPECRCAFFSKLALDSGISI